MPSTNGSYYWPSFRACLIFGSVSLWVLLELVIERLNVSLFVPQIGRDYNGTTFHSGYLVNTNGCRIPDLDPMDVSVRRFIYDDTLFDCAAKYGPALVESNLTAVYVNESVLAYYNVTGPGQISCCYTPFWREEKPRNPSGEYPSNIDSIVRFANNCTPFNGSATIHNRFVRIECFVGNRIVYKDYHAFIPEIPPTLADREKISDTKDTVNVLIFGLDSISRLNLYRQMPKTLKFLKNTLNAVEMLGYNKVEDNTFSNLIPVLSGLSVEELVKVCWHKQQYVFDDCNFIWNNYSNLGYKTAFGEETSKHGIFNYLNRGFRKQPTDYYSRIFNKIGEDDIGSGHYINLCVGPRRTWETLITYASKFLITMKEVLTFAFFWELSLSHDYLNLPKSGDEVHKEFLESLYNHGIFSNTVLVFMSDHGMRFGEIRNTYQGFLEERLPYLFVVYPDWFRSKYTTAVGNLKKNARKLTTPFDLHEMLLDLMNLTLLEKEVLRERTEVLQKAKVLSRGISLFLPISGNRTCSDAGIVDHWCTCHQSKDIPTYNILVRQASNYLVMYINYLLRDFTQCNKLTLDKIVQARKELSVSHRSFKASDAGIADLIITIQTTPGKGLFEATMRRDGNRKSFSVLGTVSRINRYGNQSLCVPNYKLRLYCYCNRD